MRPKQWVALVIVALITPLLCFYVWSYRVAGAPAVVAPGTAELRPVFHSLSRTTLRYGPADRLWWPDQLAATMVNAGWAEHRLEAHKACGGPQRWYDRQRALGPLQLYELAEVGPVGPAGIGEVVIWRKWQLGSLNYGAVPVMFEGVITCSFSF